MRQFYLFIYFFIIFFIQFTSLSRLFQLISVGGRKQETPEKNHLAHPHGYSHMWPVRGLNQFHSILFYSILFYSILFYSILFYSILFYSILFYSILFYSVPFRSVPFRSILFYSILFYSILFYSMCFDAKIDTFSVLYLLFYSTLIYL